MTKVAWIGTGVMGRPMACHLQTKGYQVYAYNRSTEKAQALAVQGEIPCDTIAQAVTDADFVFTIVFYPKDVEQVYLGEGGVFSAVKPGAVAVDMTTSSPALAKRLYAAGQEIGVSVLDAPVSGGDKGAKNAALSIMVGGDEDAFEKTKPLFACMGTSILLMGGPGAAYQGLQPNLRGGGYGGLHRGAGLCHQGGPGSRKDAGGHFRRRCGQLAAE